MAARRLAILALSGAMFALAAPVHAQDDDISATLARMMAMQSKMQGEELEAALEEASRYPLGSAQNPVRAEGPSGQRAYLDRLHCANGSRPSFERRGNLGFGVYQNIVDDYALRCGSDEPVSVVMDMYHAGHVESRAIPGFTIDP